MSTIVTRAGKGSPLTNAEVDSNFTNLNTDKVESITSADGSVVVSSSGTTRDLSVGVAGSTATLISQVRNETGATLTKGTVVYISGAAGNKAIVSKAIATGDSTSAQTYGMMQADIPHNQNGYVVVIGAVSGLNTSAFTDGTQLYLSGVSAGGYTNTKPYAPTHLVYVGIVTYSHATQGTIQVKIQNGYEMDEIHDVSARSPVNGQTLVYVSSTGLWTKTDQSAMSVGSAATLATARNINGVSFNGSADITVADATKLPLTGGTLSGKLTLDGRNEIYGVPTNAGTIAGFMGGTSGGTTAARTQSLNTQTLLNVAAIGYTGSAWVGGAGLSFVATENITAANRGTKAVLTAIDAGDSVATTMEFNGSALTINGSTAVTSSNYTTYAPTKTGTGASGTWGINITGTSNNITAYTINQNLGTGNQVTFDSVVTGNNGNGTNFRLGDDAWIGDVNIANTTRLQGVQSAASGYLIFGNGDNTALGRAGTGALTYGGNTILTSGNYNSYAPSLTGGGASGTWGISITGNAATASKTTANAGYARVGYGMAPFYNWGGANAGAGAPSDSTYTTGIDVGSHPSDQAYGFQIASNMWNVGLWTRTYNGGFSGWVRLLDSSNYSSYALPLGGGTVAGPVTITGNDNQLIIDATSGPTAGIFLRHSGVNKWEIYNSSNAFGLYNYSSGQNELSISMATGVANFRNTPTAGGNAILHAGNINSYIPSWSTGVNASHIVQRDANGYIYANHINFNTSESENDTVNSFITSNGDGWSRKASLAHVKNSIRGVADGTWSINITGNAASATTADQIDSWPFRNTGSNSSVNADSLDSNGITYYTAGVPNFTGNATDGALYSQAYNSNWQHQIAGDYRSGQIALRGKSNGTFQAWRTVLDSGNYTSYAATSGHNHTYDVNNAWLRDANDDAHVKLYGNTRQMVFRTDGTTEFASGVGPYAFAWMYGGDAASERRMLLTSAGRLWTNTHGWMDEAFAPLSHVHSYLPLSGGTMSGAISFSNVTGNKLAFYNTGTDKYGIDVQSSELRIFSGAQGDATGGITFGKHDGTTFTEWMRVRNNGAVVVSGNQVLHAGNYNSYSPTLTGGNASGTWGISVTGSAYSATVAARLQYDDGPRDLSNRLPNTFTRTVVFDFVGAGTGNGSGNYAGVMTYSPWTGTSASTGDSSYQLSFANTTGVNASGQPKLSIRNGIDSTWNAWHVLLHSGNVGSYALPLSGGTMTGSISRSTSVAGWFQGTYNNVGDNSMKSNPIYTIGSSYNPADTTLSNMYGIGYAHPNLWGASKGSGWGLYTAAAGSFTGVFGAEGNALNTWILGYGEATASWRAPIFYDSNDTAYFVDPNSGGTCFKGYGTVDSRAGFTSIGNPWGTANSAYFPNGITTAGGTNWIYGNSYIGNAPSNGAGHELQSNGNMRSTGEHRATIYYDDADTGYYCNPNNFSQLSYGNFNAAPNGRTLSLGGDQTDRILNDSNRASLVINALYYPHLYINATANASNTNHGPVFSMTGVLTAGGYRRWGMGIANTNPDCFSWGYYDNETNPHYGVGGTFGYTGTNSKMWLNTGGSLMTTGDMRAPIFYDSNDTAYYCNPNSFSQFSSGNFNNGCSFTAGTGSLYAYGNGNTASVANVGLNVASTGGNGAVMAFHREGYYAIQFGLDSDNVIRFGGWSAGANRLQMDMSGNLTMAGNVTAYSDERLKKDWAPVSAGFVESLAKIKAGTYTRIDSEERQAGVSAQDFQKLLPETISADNEGTLSLAYGNAALVSAVELAKEVVDLRNRVAHLESLINKLIGD